MDYVHYYTSPVGKITVSSDGEAVTGLWFEGQRHFASTLGSVYAEASLPVFDLTDIWLNTYFAGKIPDFAPPLRLSSSAFVKTVCRVLLTVPYGETVTYGYIAKQIIKEYGIPASAQAVGGAVGRNPISLIIPCHRVVGADGSLTGYAAGIEIKRFLLELENAIPHQQIIGRA